MSVSRCAYFLAEPSCLSSLIDGLRRQLFTLLILFYLGALKNLQGEHRAFLRTKITDSDVCYHHRLLRKLCY